MKTRQVNLVHLDTEYIGFRIKDSKNREMGIRIIRSEMDFIEDSTLECYYKVLPGHYYSFYPHVTRDKIGYGPSQSAQYFTTSEEMERVIETYITRAQKRAHKIAAK